MQETLMATFSTASNAEKAMQMLLRCGAGQQDVSVLEAAVGALLAVRLGERCTKVLARAVIGEHGGRITESVAQSPTAQAVLGGLPNANDPFKAPETIVPPPVLSAMEAPRDEQPQPVEEEKRAHRQE